MRKRTWARIRSSEAKAARYHLRCLGSTQLITASKALSTLHGSLRQEGIHPGWLLAVDIISRDGVWSGILAVFGFHLTLYLPYFMLGWCFVHVIGEWVIVCCCNHVQSRSRYAICRHLVNTTGPIPNPQSSQPSHTASHKIQLYKETFAAS